MVKAQLVSRRCSTATLQCSGNRSIQENRSIHTQKQHLYAIEVSVQHCKPIFKACQQLQCSGSKPLASPHSPMNRRCVPDATLPHRSSCSLAAFVGRTEFLLLHGGVGRLRLESLDTFLRIIFQTSTFFQTTIVQSCMPPQTQLTQTSIIQPQLTQEQYPYAKQAVRHCKLIFKG